MLMGLENGVSSALKHLITAYHTVNVKENQSQFITFMCGKFD